MSCSLSKPCFMRNASSSSAAIAENSAQPALVTKLATAISSAPVNVSASTPVDVLRENVWESAPGFLIMPHVLLAETLTLKPLPHAYQGGKGLLLIPPGSSQSEQTAST